LPSLLLKIEGGGWNSFASLFGIKFKKKKLWEVIVCFVDIEGIVI
jgi:hypothetical protein